MLKLEGKASAKALRWSILGVFKEKRARGEWWGMVWYAGAKRQVCTSRRTLAFVWNLDLDEGNGSPWRVCDLT